MFNTCTRPLVNYGQGILKYSYQILVWDAWDEESNGRGTSGVSASRHLRLRPSGCRPIQRPFPHVLYGQIRRRIFFLKERSLLFSLFNNKMIRGFKWSYMLWFFHVKGWVNERDHLSKTVWPNAGTHRKHLPGEQFTSKVRFPSNCSVEDNVVFTQTENGTRILIQFLKKFINSWKNAVSLPKKSSHRDSTLVKMLHPRHILQNILFMSLTLSFYK